MDLTMQIASDGPSTGPDSLYRGIPRFMFISVALMWVIDGVFPTSKDSMFAGGLTTAAIILSYLAYRRVLAHRSWIDLGFRIPTTFDLCIGVLGGALSIMVSIACMFMHIAPSAAEYNAFPAVAGGPFWITGYALGVIALAFSEECIFRAYLVTALEERFKPIYAIAISSLIFSALHFQGIVPIFLFAMISGSIFVWRRSLWPAVVAHSVHNLAIMLAAYSLIAPATPR